MSGRPGEVRARWAANRLGVHLRTLRRWCWEGKLSYRQDAAGRYWVRKAEVETIEDDPVAWRQGLSQ
jgi:predicted site-specific integrase-resolvase